MSIAAEPRQLQALLAAYEFLKALYLALRGLFLFCLRTSPKSGGGAWEVFFPQIGHAGFESRHLRERFDRLPSHKSWLFFSACR